MNGGESIQMTPEQLDVLIQEDLQWIEDREGAFGRWIHGLWPENHQISFNENREVFLHLIRVLLDSGKIYFQEPAAAPYGERRVLNTDVWAAPHDYIIEHIDQRLPKDLTDHHDTRLTDFWYDVHCPRLLWYDPEDDSLFGS